MGCKGKEGIYKKPCFLKISLYLTLSKNQLCKHFDGIFRYNEKHIYDIQLISYICR